MYAAWINDTEFNNWTLRGCFRQRPARLFDLDEDDDDSWQAFLMRMCLHPPFEFLNQKPDDMVRYEQNHGEYKRVSWPWEEEV